ncbi:hypothetical protein MNV49_003461 [Pseudohyphozyma bogoriensis]|nr:hypothetical protein MNV49_003461 [Pseudohyphozyma bogoriensis]
MMIEIVSDKKRVKVEPKEEEKPVCQSPSLVAGYRRSLSPAPEVKKVEVKMEGKAERAPSVHEPKEEKPGMGIVQDFVLPEGTLALPPYVSNPLDIDTYRLAPPSATFPQHYLQQQLSFSRHSRQDPKEFEAVQSALFARSVGPRREELPSKLCITNGPNLISETPGQPFIFLHPKNYSPKFTRLGAHGNVFIRHQHTYVAGDGTTVKKWQRWHYWGDYRWKTYAVRGQDLRRISPEAKQVFRRLLAAHFGIKPGNPGKHSTDGWGFRSKNAEAAMEEIESIAEVDEICVHLSVATYKGFDEAGWSKWVEKSRTRLAKEEQDGWKLKKVQRS